MLNTAFQLIDVLKSEDQVAYGMSNQYQDRITSIYKYM